MATGKGRRGAGTALGLAVLAAACILLSARPAGARVTVSVHLTYGAVLAGGVGLYIVFAAAWDLHLGEAPPSSALLELRGRSLRWGLPIPSPAHDPGGERVEGWRADILRIRF